MARQNKYQVTRKPRNHAEVAQRFASGLGRPWTDGIGNVSIGDNYIPHYYADGEEAKKASRTTFISYNTPIAWMSPDGLRVWFTPHSYSVSTSQHQSHLRSALWNAGFKETDNAIWMPSINGGRYYGSGGRNIEYTEWKRTAKSRDKAMEEEANRPANSGMSRWGYTPPYVAPKMVDADPAKKWYKVTDENGCAYSGGEFQFSLPTGSDPGEWTPETLVAWCQAGWHVTDRPILWMRGDKCRIFEVEVSGNGITLAGQDKSVWPSIRLVREITHEEAKSIAPIETYA